MKGEKMVQQECNLFSIIQTIQKLKAAVSVLMCESQLKETRQLYFENAQIRLDPQEEEDFHKTKNPVLKFLERDEKYGFKHPGKVPNKYVLKM
jgi:hypothetical protein